MSNTWLLTTKRWTTFDVLVGHVRCLNHAEDATPAHDARTVTIAYNTESAAGSKTGTVTAPGPNGMMTYTVHWQVITIGDDGRKYEWNLDRVGQQ